MSDNYVIAYTPNSRLAIGLNNDIKATAITGVKAEQLEFTETLSLSNLLDYLTYKLPRSLGLAFEDKNPCVLTDVRNLLKMRNISDASFYLHKMYQGWGSSRHGHNWVDRTLSWSEDTKYLVLDPLEGYWCLYSKKDYVKLIKQLSGLVRENTAKSAIPLFNNLLDKRRLSVADSQSLVRTQFIYVHKPESTGELHVTGRTIASNTMYATYYGSESTKLKINTQEKEMSLFDKLKDANVEAAKLAGTLTVGKAANDLLANALVAKLPWYSRLFSGTALRESSLTKLATANLTMVLAAHFGKGNEKLDFVANAMLQDAMVELVRDSDQLKGLLDQLANLAGSAGDITK